MSLWPQRLAALAAALLLFFGVVWFTRLQFMPVSASPTPVAVEIPLGSSLNSIADRLAAAGLIRSKLVFILTARALGESESMKAGEYRIPRNLGLIEIIDLLVAGRAESKWVVIPEGKTLRQIAALLDRQRLANANEFLRAASRKPKAFGLEIPVSRRSLEGFLMPDTYKFPMQVNERTLIQEMLRNWHEKVYRPHRRLFEESGLSVDEVVIIASMIEREARVPQDRPLIASVIHNRLKRGMPLQVDATVQYGLPAHKSRLTFQDLKNPHAYNTYRRRGLPPGPICNPGLDCILAALRPAQTEYLYYVARPDGSHIFSRTYEEHLAAIRKVRAMKGQARAGTGARG